MTATTTPAGLSAHWRPPAATAVLLVAVAWAFLPLDGLPSFDVVKLALLVPAVAALSFAAARRRGPGAVETALRDPLLLVPAVLAVSASIAAVLAWPRGSLAGPALCIAAVAAARLVPPGAEGVRSTLRAAAVAAAGAGTYALLQKLGRDPAPWGDRREVVATFGNTSFAAEFQAAALPMAMVLALRPGRTRGDAVLGWTAAALSVTHLVLARSRVDLVGAAAAVAAVVVCVMADRRRARIVAAAAGAAGVAAAALFSAAASGAIAWLGRSDTLQVRLHVWRSTLALAADAPFRFGGAPFVDLYPPWRSPDEYRISLGRVVDTPHADLLEVGSTLGAVGLAAAVVVLVLLARRLATLRRSLPWETAALAGALAAVAVSGLASSPLTHPATALVAALAVGHVVRLAPRPMPLGAWAARAADGVAFALLVAAFWPGPALRSLRSDTFVALAMGERAAGRADRAALLFDEACGADPQSFTARYELGTLLLSRGEGEAAVRALEAAGAIRPNDPECRTNRVLALREVRRDDDADRLLDASLALCPWHPLLLAARAARATAHGDFAAAAADLDRAAALRPGDLRIRAVRAEARLGASPDEASRTEALDVLAAIHGAGDGRLFVRAVRAFAARDAAFLAVLTARATRIADERPDEAAALVWAPVDGLAPEDPGFFEAAAKVLRRTGHPDESTRLLGRALGVRARLALAAGDADTARRLAFQASERDDIPEHLVTEALALARVGDRRAVCEALAAAIVRGPVDADAFRRDPYVARLLPDPSIEELLTRAADPSRR